RPQVMDAAEGFPVFRSAQERAVSQGLAGRVLPGTHLCDAGEIVRRHAGAAGLLPVVTIHRHVLKDVFAAVFNPGTEICGRPALPPPPPLAAMPALPADLFLAHAGEVCSPGKEKKVRVLV